LRPWSTSLPTTKWNWRSGRSTSGSLRTKPPASAKFVVSMPLRPTAPFEDASQQVDRAAQRQAEQVGEVRRVEDGDDVDVIVQVAADAGQVVADVDAERAQVLARADARQHQQLRRLQRAGDSSTSRRAGTNVGTPSMRASTPVARPPSRRISSSSRR
jgi:hypothetical protein